MSHEKELVKKAAAGDLDAFERLVHIKKEKVFWISYQVIGNEEDARDISQLVFIKLWKILGRFRAEKNFNTWLYRITVNMSIDYMRTQKARGETVPLDEESLLLSKGQGETDRVYRLMELQEIQKIYLFLSRSLTPKQRAIFALKEIEGFSTEDISRIMKVRPSTIRNHLLQARHIMKKGLQRYFPEYLIGDKKS